MSPIPVLVVALCGMQAEREGPCEVERVCPGGVIERS